MIDIETVQKALIIVFIGIPLALASLVLFAGLIAGAIHTWKKEDDLIIVDGENA